jgi:hypothetical protein
MGYHWQGLREYGFWQVKFFCELKLASLSWWLCLYHWHDGPFVWTLEANKTCSASIGAWIEGVDGTTTRPRYIQISPCHFLASGSCYRRECITRLPAVHFGNHRCHHVSHNTFTFVVRVRLFVCYVRLTKNAWPIRNALPWLLLFGSRALKAGMHQYARSVQSQ